MTSEGYELRVWPSRLYAVPVALFTFLWLRFLWRWYALLLLGSGLSSHHHSRSFFLLFGLPFLFAGLSLVGTTLRLWFGRTSLHLDAMRLVVKDGYTGRPEAFGGPVILPTISIKDFVAETSSLDEACDERELDAWRVCVRSEDGHSLTLPLPVRTLKEADVLATRLNRALADIRAPRGYREGLGASSSDGSDSPLGASMM